MLLDEIRTLLEQEGIGVFGTDLFAGLMPDTPDSLVALFAYAGGPPEWDHDGPGPAWEVAGLQVQVRNFDLVEAFERADAIYDLLAQVRNRDLADAQGRSTRYRAVVPLQSPYQLGLDDARRHLVVCNFQAYRSRR